MQRLPVRGNTQRRHSGSLMGAHALTYHLLRANQVGFQHQVIRDECYRRLTLASQPEVLHLQSHLRIPGTLVDFIVEVVLARTHSTQGERQAGFA